MAAASKISAPGQTGSLQSTGAAGIFKKRLLHHILFWLGYYAVFSGIVVFGVYHVTTPIFYLQLIPIYLLDIAMVYFNFYVLMPRLMVRRRYWYYFFSLSLTVICMGCLNVMVKQVYTHNGSALFAYSSAFTFSNVIGAITERYYAVILTGGIKIAKNWIENQQRMKEKENQLLEAELNFLKSQIQPHFFFNTLNNLYSLTLKKSDEAPEVVLKLSDLMSYMLYESNTPMVALQKEITYLENYIALEKLRFGKNLALSFEVEGQVEGVYVPPLVLILFVENSFKHGARNAANSLAIDILLAVENGFLFFTVTNPFAEKTVARTKSGIGLKNARRRLHLLYTNNYTLEEVRKENRYAVSLKIPV